MMMSCRLARPVLVAAVAAGAVLAGARAAAIVTQSTPRLVTNTTGGKNQNPSINKNGKLIVFTSAVNHDTNVGPNNSNCGLPPGDTEPFTFDFDCTGNDFSDGSAPQPVCLNCNGNDTGNSNLFLWRQRKRRRRGAPALPANSIQQLTFTTGGGFKANANPDISQRGKFIAWESDREHAGTGVNCANCDNADGNREIFLYDIDHDLMQQVTFTTGGLDASNRAPNLNDRATRLVFDSNRDFAGASCAMLGGGPCDNADGNSEIMLWERGTDSFTQITNTTGKGNNANTRPRISNDGRYIAFQSTRDLSGQALPCTQIDGVTPCDNADANGEIYLVDTKALTITQVTNTPNAGPCSGATANERVEISNRGKMVSFQSRCEASLNPGGCASCNGNDEVFIFERRKRRILQLTISDAGFNRVPRISGNSGWVVFESNRNYKNLNPAHARTLYILRRNRNALVVEDASGPLQNPKTKLISINFAGGFNTSVEAFGVSTSGRFIAFDNKKGQKNQEIWYLDRNR